VVVTAYSYPELATKSQENTMLSHATGKPLIHAGGIQGQTGVSNENTAQLLVSPDPHTERTIALRWLSEHCPALQLLLLNQPCSHSIGRCYWKTI
jgi:hypothetical protein